MQLESLVITRPNGAKAIVEEMRKAKSLRASCHPSIEANVLIEESRSYQLETLIEALGVPSIESGRILVEDQTVKAVRYSPDNPLDASSSFARWNCSATDQCIAMMDMADPNSAILLHMCAKHKRI